MLRRNLSDRLTIWLCIHNYLLLETLMHYMQCNFIRRIFICVIFITFRTIKQLDYKTFVVRCERCYHSKDGRGVKYDSGHQQDDNKLPILFPELYFHQ